MLISINYRSPVEEKIVVSVVVVSSQLSASDTKSLKGD